ncbi:hypothetical protein PR048_026563 [Dryococelus australis]|uniref:Uncharacterized protein n=1 Tax=Dryococelus australis TaxID=614101 RepID=A0ABQ9GLR2_9NEOP|nr:hypothetical protein PR048_026563 [Dryococelus australis]
MAASVESINILEQGLSSGPIFGMDVLEEIYLNSCSSKNVRNEVMIRKQLKAFIETQLSDKDIEFSRPNQVSKPQRFSMKSTRDKLVAEAVAYGLTIPYTTRKCLIKFMYYLGCSIYYSRVLRLETDIAKSVVNGMNGNNGIYILPDFIPNRFIHCAMDDADFCEDAIDGRTFHGTAVTVYQDMRESDRNSPISSPSSENMPLIFLQDALPNILSCTKPPNWNTCFPEPVVSNIVLQYGVTLNNAICCDEVRFLLRRSLLNDDNTIISSPMWIGYNCHLGEVRSVFPEFPCYLLFQILQLVVLYN